MATIIRKLIFPFLFPKEKPVVLTRTERRRQLHEEYNGVHVGRSLWKEYMEGRSSLDDESMALLLEIPEERLL